MSLTLFGKHVNLLGPNLVEDNCHRKVNHVEEVEGNYRTVVVEAGTEIAVQVEDNYHMMEEEDSLHIVEVVVDIEVEDTVGFAG